MIEAGLRVKITDLTDDHRDVAIADCIGDTLGELKRLREMLAACQEVLRG